MMYDEFINLYEKVGGKQKISYEDYKRLIEPVYTVVDWSKETTAKIAATLSLAYFETVQHYAQAIDHMEMQVTGLKKRISEIQEKEKMLERTYQEQLKNLQTERMPLEVQINTVNEKINQFKTNFSEVAKGIKGIK